MACQRRVEAHIREPSTADEPLPDGPAEQRALVGEAEAGEVRIRPQLTGRELLAVVDDRDMRRAATVQEVVEVAGAHGITGSDIKRDRAFERLGHVDSESVQPKKCARRPSSPAPVAASGKFPDLEAADWEADAAVQRDLPPAVDYGVRSLERSLQRQAPGRRGRSLRPTDQRNREHHRARNQPQGVLKIRQGYLSCPLLCGPPDQSPRTDPRLRRGQTPRRREAERGCRGTEGVAPEWAARRTRR